MRRWSPLLSALPLLLLGGCLRPDAQALQKLACEQAAASLDMQSVSQLDALRKALGVAPGVDPIEQCRALGARMEAPPAAGSPSEQPSGAAGDEAARPAAAGGDAASEQEPGEQEGDRQDN